MKSFAWLAMGLSIGVLGAGWLRGEIGANTTVYACIAGLIIAGFVLVTDTDNDSGSQKLRPDVQARVKELGKLSGYERAESISKMLFPVSLTDYEASQILGDLTGSYRVSAIESLADRLHGLAKTSYVQALGNLEGSYRARAIEVITAMIPLNDPRIRRY